MIKIRIAINRPGSSKQVTKNCIKVTNVKLVMIAKRINNGTLCTSKPNPTNKNVLAINAWMIPIANSTPNLAKNQLRPLVGMPAGSRNGYTIDNNNAPTNKPRDKSMVQNLYHNSVLHLSFHFLLQLGRQSYYTYFHLCQLH